MWKYSARLLLRAIKSSKLWGQIPGGEKRIKQVNYEEERGEYMQVLSLIAQSADVHASNVRIFLRILVLIAVILAGDWHDSRASNMA